MPISAEIISHFINSVIQTIARRSSEEYAVVMVKTSLQHLQNNYEFLKSIHIAENKYAETGKTITIDSSIEGIDQTDLGNALKTFIEYIVNSMGKNAGFFYIKELKENLGQENEKNLRTMGIDLDVLHYSHITQKQHGEKLVIENSDVIKQIFKCIIDLMGKKISRSFAISKLLHFIEHSEHSYSFLNFVTLRDVQSALGSEEIHIDEKLNSLSSESLGQELQLFLTDIQKGVFVDSTPNFFKYLQEYLTQDYNKKIKEMNVEFVDHQFNFELIFRHVLKALIDVMGRASSQSYAITVLNTFLRKIDTKFTFLKDIRINLEPDMQNDYNISIMTNLGGISELEARRAIQKLLEEIIIALGTELGDHFINEFKKSIDGDCLLTIEDIGVNLHILHLRQDFLS